MTNQDKTRWKQIRNKGEKWRNTGEKKRCKLNQRIEALTPMSFLFTPVGRLVDWPVWGAVFSPFRGSHAQWRPFWRPMVSLTGQLGLLLSSKRGCGRGKRKRLLLKKCNGWWLDKRLIDWLIDWNKGMADWMNGILKETKTKCSSKLCEEEVNYKCVDISIYISLLWIDSARLGKKYHCLGPFAIRFRRWWSWRFCRDFASELLSHGGRRSTYRWRWCRDCR